MYLVVDAYTGRRHLCTQPEDGEYRGELTFDLGDEIDLTGTVVGLVLKTDESPATDLTSPLPGHATAASSSRRSRGTKRTLGWPWCQPTDSRSPPTRARISPMVVAARTATAPPVARPIRAP